MSGARSRFGFAIGAVVLLAALLPGAAAGVDSQVVRPDNAGKVVPNSWIVTLQPRGNPTRDAPGLARSAGGQVGHVYTHALRGFEFKGSAQAADALRHNPNVRTVIPNRTIAATADTIPTGVSRIRANHQSQPSAYSNGFRGAGVRIAILDTGVDLTHPDLTPNLDTNLGLNCMTSGLPPQDGHGHGTHVSGIAAAAANGIGVVGVAPSARILPIKVLDDTGQGEWSNLICGIDYITGLDQDGDPTNNVRVANMSLGDTGSIGNCSDGGVREAICTSTAVGIVYVAAAGNSTVDTAGFIPAAFPEVIAVSSINDLDGEPGGLGGCLFFIFYCDDRLSEFSNYGASVDVAAPGFEIYSDWTGGGYNTIDGTSMASPHVAGVAALALSVQPALSPSDVMALLKATGDCPNTQPANADGTCTGKGQWGNDPDGIAEPVVNALRAAQNAGPYDHPPTVTLTSPTDGSSVSGVVPLAATAADDVGVSSVEFTINGAHLATDTDGSNGWTASWNTAGFAPGVYTVAAIATDTGSHTAVASSSVSLGANQQGNWVGNYGSQGYALAAWNNTSDLAVLPSGATLTFQQGTRYTWAAPSTDSRALQSPDQSQRRAATWTDNTDLQLRLDFASAYAGSIHFYAVDWDSLNRREAFTIDDGSGARTAKVTTSYVNGVWVHFPVNVPAGGSIQIHVNATQGLNGVLSGIFLGGAGVPLPPPPPGPPTLTATGAASSVSLSWTAAASSGPVSNYKIYRGTTPGGETLLTTLGNVLSYSDSAVTVGTTYYYKVSAVNANGEGAASNEASAIPHAPPPPPTFNIPGPQGDWVGRYGVDGYVLASWDAGADLVALPAGRTLTVQTADRFTWASPTTDVRALENASQTERRAATWHGNTIQLRLNFNSAYSGTLHLYAVDWDNIGRQETITVDDGDGPRTVSLTSSFANGAWAHFPFTVGTGGAVQITVTKTAGLNGVLSGIFLGDSPPTVAGAPSLSLVSGNGSDAASWTPPISNGGSPIGGYKLYRGTTSGGETLLTTLGNVTSYTDTAVTNGTTYYYKVSALNGVGEGPASAERSAMPRAPSAPPTGEIPGVQGDWVGQYGADGYALGAWNGTTDLLGLPAGVSLNVQRAQPYVWASPSTDVRALENASQTERRGATWFDSNEVDLQLVFTAAYTGTLHLYAVDWDSLSRLENVTVDDGSGPRTFQIASSFVNGAWVHFPIVVTPGGSVQITIVRTGGMNAVLSGIFLGNAGPSATVPGAPTGLSATRGNGQVALTWTAPSSDGGSAITGYTATASPGGASCSTASLTCTVSGLSNGTAYSFTVAATNSVGTGPASAPVSATPATTPGAPTGLTATRGNGQVMLNWSAPTSDGGSAIIGYNATASPGGATCATGGLSCTISGLTNGTTYTFTVAATNAVGAGPSSAPVSATPAAVPGAPTGLTATRGNAQVALSWTAPSSDGGSPITGYMATASPGGATCSPANLSNLTCTVTGLTNGTTYSFAVVATNAVGSGPPSASASATPATTPGAPTGLTATRGNQQVALIWTAPSSNGGSAITSYTATASPGGATCSPANLSNLTCTVSGLTNGTNYSFTVVATNGVGTGPASAPVSATPATTPDAPTGLTATAGNTQVQLSWTAPVSNGGSAITSYTATASPGGATCSPANLSNLTCTVTGLTNGTSYSFTVVATNAVGSGPASAPASATPDAVPGAPNLTTATPGDTSVALTWTAPAPGGSPVTAYKVYRGTTAGGEIPLTTLGNVTTYTDTAVTNGTTYYYKVSAVNAVGEGLQSNERSARPAGLPGAPTGLTASTSRSKGIDLAWAPPASNGGSAITGYRIYRSTSSGTEVFLIAVGNVTSYRDNSAGKNTRYYYKVTAVNALGESFPSNEANAVAK